MSFIGQSIRNNFPLWSKIRRDDSSTGAIIFEGIGSEIESLRTSLLSSQEQSKVFSPNPVYEPGSMYVFSLNESLDFNLYKDSNRTYGSLVATGIKDEVEYPLTNVFSYSELAKSFASRIEASLFCDDEDYLIETILKETTEDPYLRRESNSIHYFNKIPKRLYLNIFDSEDYEISTYNRSMYNKRYVVLRGTDIFGKRIEETISITKDGFYKSKNLFRTLEPLEGDALKSISGGGSIECYGFDGTVEVMKYPLQIQRKSYPFKLLVKKVDDLNYKDSLEENIGEFEISDNPYLNGTVLNYIFRTYEFSEEYVNKRTGLEKSYFEQIVLQQQLLDDSSLEITAQDFCFDYSRDKVVVIDQNAKLYWYRVDATKFESQAINRTKKSNITLESEKQQVLIGETLPIFASLERAKGNVSEVIIAKQKPSIRNRVIDANGEVITNFNFEYLQEDFSWSEEKYFFSGEDSDDIYLNFEGKTIEVLFDEYGQHDFYVISFASNFNREESLTNFKNGDISETEFKNQLNSFLKDENQETVLIDTYSVICEATLPDISYETDILTQIEAAGENSEEFSLGVFFEGHENTLYISATNELKTFIFKVKEYKDYILFDYEDGRGALLEEYDSVKLTINNSYEEEVVYNG